MNKKTDILESILTSCTTKNSLDSFLKSNKNYLDTLTFCNYFEILYENKEIKKSVIVNESNISRTYCYEILRGDKLPDKDNVLKLCFAARLSVKETNKLLKLTNNGLLYPKTSRDAIIAFCLQNEYTLMQVDAILYEKNLETLISE